MPHNPSVIDPQGNLMPISEVAFVKKVKDKYVFVSSSTGSLICYVECDSAAHAELVRDAFIGLVQAGRKAVQPDWLAIKALAAA